MDIRRGFVICSFGPERQEVAEGIVENIRKFSSLPIILITDNHNKMRTSALMEKRVIPQRNFQWADNTRWPVRNCNVFSAEAALSTFLSCCVLNDDMRIVDRGFADGFLLAERFGVCVPANPRIYVRYNALGADAEPQDFVEGKHGPAHAPACNVSPMFVCRELTSARMLIGAYMDELKVCMRGTLAFWRASWRTGITPVYLPEQWCVGASNAKYLKDYKKRLLGKEVKIEAMMLHWGQLEVRETFNAEVK